ncbi:MAG: hypothetical protein E6Q97_22245 [Desulfurellales bacterium]|nr:MAG: hypothetical protein E6Q97_22245 [Desulfurellales bacterium]
MASKIDQQIDAINAARKAAQKRAKNPLTRVKVNSPSMLTKKAPSKRLVARRKKTERAPKGVYANPVVGVHVDRKKQLPNFPYLVQIEGTAGDGDWFTEAGFRLLSRAEEYAHFLHRKIPSARIRVLDRF